MKRSIALMGIRIPVLAVAILLLPVLTFSQGPKPTAEKPPARHVVVAPEQLVWKLILPGTEMAVVSGDPAGNVIEIYGEAPFVINWVNPEDDPNRPKAK